MDKVRERRQSKRSRGGGKEAGVWVRRTVYFKIMRKRLLQTPTLPRPHRFN
jgi:hypothetical protein